MTINIQEIASSTLDKMKTAGFDSVQVSVAVSEQDELNISHNEASLLRSTEDYNVSLMGIIDGIVSMTFLDAQNLHPRMTLTLYLRDKMGTLSKVHNRVIWICW
jgi:hypothetical protein